MTKLLYLEDNKVDQLVFTRFMKGFSEEFEYTLADSVGLAKECLEKETYDVMITDFILGDGTGMDILALNLDIPVIVMTGSGNEEIAVKAMKAGAKDYLIKDLGNNYLKILPITIERVLKQKQTDNDLAKNVEALARSNAELEQFAYVASHDLQEPLRTISNFAGLINEQYSGKIDEEADKYLNFILAATFKMQSLIKDLLEFSKIGSNILFTKTDCNILVKDLIAELDATIKESGAKITYTKLPVLNGNEMELKQLFLNLISNAIKFRKKNATPEIHISAEEKDTEYFFTISDNGIGIDEKYKEQIFVIFQRLYHSKEYPGTGIGLATCKKIVSLHQGEIWIDSKLGQGSTFCFTLSKSIE